MVIAIKIKISDATVFVAVLSLCSFAINCCKDKKKYKCIIVMLPKKEKLVMRSFSKTMAVI